MLDRFRWRLPKEKRKHWRGVPGICGLQCPPIAAFRNPLLRNTVFRRLRLEMPDFRIAIPRMVAARQRQQ